MALRLVLFLSALTLCAQDVETHLRRGADLMQRVIPGDPAPANRDLVRNANAEFEAALRYDPSNVQALRSLGQMAYAETSAAPDLPAKLAQLDAAERWYRRLASADSRSTEAVYHLGVIAWAKAYPQVVQARAQLGMRPEDPPPLRDAGIRNELEARVGSIIRDGIVQLETALAIDPKADDAMAYMNLLYRLQADLSPTTPEALQLIAKADDWVMQALVIKRAKGGAAANQHMVPAPPPPPPPAGMPKQIRIGGNVQQLKLINAPTPVYPPLAQQARIQGVVRFNATIAEDGRIANLTLVSGHPLLVPSATEAVRQYVYQPTLLNGVPVQVVTVVDVNFTL